MVRQVGGPGSAILDRVADRRARMDDSRRSDREAADRPQFRVDVVELEARGEVPMSDGKSGGDMYFAGGLRRSSVVDGGPQTSNIASGFGTGGRRSSRPWM